MHISARCRYALQAVLEMSKAPSGAVLKVAEIAARPEIPADYLVQVLALLKTAGIVESVRGKMGGYRLAKAPSQITVADVVEAVEPASPPATDISPALANALNEADQVARAVLADTTFAELCRREQEERLPASYYI